MSTLSNTTEIEAGAVRFLIDAEDADRAAQHRWTLYDNKRGHRYAQAYIRIDGAHSRVRLHRFLLNAQGGVVDHINGDTLDNRKANLRLSDYSTNSINRRRANGGPTKANGGWIVRLMVSGKTTYHGFYQSLDEAKAKFDQVIGDSYAR